MRGLLPAMRGIMEMGPACGAHIIEAFSRPAFDFISDSRAMARDRLAGRGREQRVCLIGMCEQGEVRDSCFRT